MGRIGAWIGVLVASVLLHAIVLSGLKPGPLRPFETPASVVDITFTVAETESDAPEPAEKEEPPAARPAGDRKPKRRVEVSTNPVAAQPEGPNQAPAQAEPDSVLDIRSTARAFVVSQEPMPVAPGSAKTKGPKPASYFEGVGTKNYLSTREPPILRPHRDGTHRYRGNTFKAIIERDGSVTFDDGYRQGTTVSFDITDHMMRKRGEDPYRVEKQWFLDNTAELRRNIFERWRAKQLQISLAKLRARVARILEDETLSEAQKTARVLAMYRDTADDEAGAAAREAIATIVEKKNPGLRLSQDSL